MTQADKERVDHGGELEKFRTLLPSLQAELEAATLKLGQQGNANYQTARRRQKAAYALSSDQRRGHELIPEERVLAHSVGANRRSHGIRSTHTARN